MEITNVIRGEEWLPSTPKHVLLYKAFGWDAPQFAHLPLILNPDKTKLSKRQGDVAVEDFLRKGYLPEALANFVALLGWNPKGDQEVYALQELIDLFDIKGINKAGAVLNQEKLYWMNGEYIRKKPLKELAGLCIPYFIEAELVREEKEGFVIMETGEKVSKEWLTSVVGLEQERLRRLDEIPQLTSFFFREKPDYTGEMLVWKKSNKEDTAEALKKITEYLSGFGEKEFERKNLETRIKNFLEEKQVPAGNALWPMRVALSGLLASPSPFEIAEVLGKEKTLARLRDAINKL
jgi:glutamyl/glutaminyl-tRNA synthetase